MHKGDISTSVDNPMIYIVWEGMVAVPGPAYTAKKFARRGRYLHPAKALDLYATNQTCVEQIWEMWAVGQPVVIVTYLNEKYLGALHDRLAREGVPHARLLATNARAMSHRVALDRACRYLVDAEPLRQLTYGPKGRYIAPTDAQLIGRML